MNTFVVYIGHLCVSERVIVQVLYPLLCYCWFLFVCLFGFCFLFSKTGFYYIAQDNLGLTM